MTEQKINGFDVRCVVLPREDRRYQVVIATKRDDEDSKDLQWDIPGTRFFGTSDEAMRYGRYVLLGISAVAPDGRPLFTVV
jgi:hypothetical protein